MERVARLAAAERQEHSPESRELQELRGLQERCPVQPERCPVQPELPVLVHLLPQLVRLLARLGPPLEEDPLRAAEPVACRLSSSGD